MTTMMMAKKLRAEDIQVRKGNGRVSSNGSFQANMLEALKIKEADMARPNDQQIQLLPKTWEGTIDHAQFLNRTSTGKKKTNVMLDFFQETPVEGD